MQSDYSQRFGGIARLYGETALSRFQQSHICVIVIGGVGSVFGGVVGAVLLLVCEEVFVEITPHWQIGLGGILLAVVLWAPLGIAGLFGWGRNRE